MNSDSLRPGVPHIPGLRDSVPGAAYKKGDVIDQKYEVYGVLGSGGFGIVYLVYSRESKGVYALKTFRDEYLADAQARERFHTEASVWVDLGRHPYLVRAHIVEEIAGRLFIAMEHIAPDEHGLNTLEGYLRQRPPDLAQSLRWAIQLCHGMEYAYSKGIRCHRDIKPGNIMIGQGKVVKITDFGLAGVLGPSQAMSGIKLNTQQGMVGLSGQTIEGTGFGTPTHMPPEQFTDAGSCDERSDIYSFGVVLFQMASGGRLPFLAPSPTDNSEAEKLRFGLEMHRLHARAPVPTLRSPFFPLIQRCMEKEPGKRYPSFKELRGDLGPLLRRQTGEAVIPPDLGALKGWEWANKGYSLDCLGRCEEAIRCYDKALELDPQNNAIWYMKGRVLGSLGRHEEAIRCHDEALGLDPRDAMAWSNRGFSLDGLGRHDDAMRCYDKALELDPLDARAWYNKGCCLDNLGRPEEAVSCFDKTLELDPRLAAAWNNKGTSLGKLSRHEEGIRCYDKALALDPRDARAWCNKGRTLGGVSRYDEAIRCFDEALQLDPRYAKAWYDKGLCLHHLSLYNEAIRCFDKALELDLRYTSTWYTKGTSLSKLGRHEEAVLCFDKTLELDPRDAMAWYAKALAQEKLGRSQDAVRSYKQFIALAPIQWPKQLEYAQQRVRELDGR
ncbi:MAG: serine/threonine-protein kinase [candidate division WOR-3 bacterium]|nr:serine/threonine-protein kinase [candidate division WOR-3 bacterium]